MALVVRSQEAVGTEVPTAPITRSLDRGEQSTGGAIEREPGVLPGRALTETCQPLHVAPDGPRIRLVLFCQSVGVGRLLPRQLESLDGCLDHLLAGGAELLGRGPQKNRPVIRKRRVERGADGIEGCRPRFVYRRTHMPPSEGGDVGESPR